jgi:tight adherence protein B
VDAHLSATLLAFAAGSLGALATAEVAAVLAPGGLGRAPRLAHRIAILADALRRPGREGREPGAEERRRLLLTAAGATFLTTTLLFGPIAGSVAAAAAPLLIGRALRERREHYREAVASGAAEIAVGLADALGGGHSIRGAIIEAAAGIEGPPGRELQRVASELRLGARTEGALEALRERARSHEVDTIVAGILLARRSGGDLAGLLRDSARAFEDQARLVGEVRAATAQARFTGVVVVLLPLGGAALVELASPGFLAGLADGFLTAWLVGLALVMQIAAAAAIRRLGRVRE